MCSKLGKMEQLLDEFLTFPLDPIHLDFTAFLLPLLRLSF